MVNIIDENGFFIGVNTLNASIEQGLNYVEVAIPLELIKPKWNGAEWVEGATTEEIAEATKPIVPSEVALWKIRTVLKLMQLETTIETALNTLSEPTKTAALYIWDKGNTIERYSPTVLFLQSELQMTDEQVDDIFIQANEIVL